MSDWKRREIKEKKRKAYKASRVSPDHEMSGVRHRQPHREKDMALNWKVGKDGTYHVTPSSIKIGGGINISDDDWNEIFRNKGKDDEV